MTKNPPVFDEDATTAQAPFTFKPVVEEKDALPIGRLDIGGIVQTQLPEKKTSSSIQKASRYDLRRWLSALGDPLLVLVMNVGSLESSLQKAAEDIGFSVIQTDSVSQAYQIAVSQPLVAMVCEKVLADGSGQDLWFAIRNNFEIRETPFLILPSKETEKDKRLLESEIVTATLESIVLGLSPKVVLYKNLKEGPKSGWMENIGVGDLLHTLHRECKTGKLQVKWSGLHMAEVIFHQGEICGVTVKTKEESGDYKTSVGPLALLNLVGFEWQEFIFTLDTIVGTQVPLGEFKKLLKTACMQNNALLQRIFDGSATSADMVFSSRVFDSYIKTVQPAFREVITQLVSGTPAATLKESKILRIGVLKKLLCDLRLKTIIRAQSVRSLKNEDAAMWKRFVGDDHISKWPKWLVISVFGVLPVLLGVGGYLVYRFLSS